MNRPYGSDRQRRRGLRVCVRNCGLKIPGIARDVGTWTAHHLADRAKNDFGIPSAVEPKLRTAMNVVPSGGHRFSVHADGVKNCDHERNHLWSEKNRDPRPLRSRGILGLFGLIKRAVGAGDRRVAPGDVTSSP